MRVKLEYYNFDSDHSEGVSNLMSESFDCTQLEFKAMSLFAYGRKQLDDYSSCPDYHKAVAWLADCRDIPDSWIIDEFGDAVDLKLFIEDLKHRDCLEFLFETVECDLPSTFEYYDNRGGDHPTFQPGGVVSIVEVMK